jgi:metal-sulfur cluster biosynthetic enzyme
VNLRDTVWQALETVLDPELDEPITDLDFVASCTVSGDGVASVHLRLPTFFCAPNFSFLMVADAYDAVRAVDGVTRAEIVLDDHHASAEINDGVAAHAGFVDTFEGEAEAELVELRRYFLEKAVVAGQGRVARPQVDAGVGPEELAERAGLRIERLDEVICPFDYADEDELLGPLFESALGREVGRRAGPAALRAAVLERLAPYRTRTGGYRLLNLFRVLVGRPA